MVDPSIEDQESSGTKSKGIIIKIVKPDEEDEIGTVQKHLQDLQSMIIVIQEVRDIFRRLDVEDSPLVVSESQYILAFMQIECEAEFARCFASQGWPRVKIPKMMATWHPTKPTVGERHGQIISALFGMETSFKDLFYRLKH